jgi:hypothetical protein
MDNLNSENWNLKSPPVGDAPVGARREARIQNAINSAAEFLVGHQSCDGCWHDFLLPVGISDSWATAYIGWSLAITARQTANQAAATAASKAGEWLLNHRFYSAGWGYNARSGADTDSTGLAIALLDELGMAISVADRQFLLSGWRPGGGFATFPARSDCWGAPHADVIWPAFAGLPSGPRQELAGELMAYLDRVRAADGLWYGYWWVEPYYCSYHALLASEYCTATNHHAPPFLHNWQSVSWAANALIAGLMNRWGVGGDRVWQLVEPILTAQDRTGKWKSSCDLRVTNPSVASPSDSLESGRKYSDQNDQMTTATILRVLVSERWVQ